MGEVNAIEKKGKRLIVTIDNEKYNISYAMMRERPLVVGEEVDIEEYDQWVMLREYPGALDYALSLIAMRDCSRGEIRDKLRRRGYRPCTVDMALYKLQREKLLDDESFAKGWVERRKESSLGARRIAYELKRKGVSQEEIDNAMEQFTDEEQLESAVELAKKGFSKEKPGDTPQKLKNRVLGLLARRGFSYDISREAISQVWDQIKNGEDEWEDDCC